jgi:glycosyltransferase involved in cell wall biosynthesis
MTDAPFISVVIPTYNRAGPLVAALRSVLDQTYLNLEVVVVDDGSTDGTAEAVQALIEQRCRHGGCCVRINCLRQPNCGQSKARNNGASMAKGDWVAFLDSDDIWLPQKLELQVRAIEQFKSSCGACFTDARLVDSLGMDETAFARTGADYRGLIGLASNAVRTLANAFGRIWLQTLVVRRDLFNAIGGFDTTLHFAEDHDFLFRVSLETQFAYVNQPLVVIDRTSRVFDPRAEPRLWDKPDFRLRSEQRRLEKWLNLATHYPSDVRRTVKRNLRGVHSCWANWYLETGQFGLARRAAETAIRYQFTPPLAIKWMLILMTPKIAKRIAPDSINML